VPVVFHSRGRADTRGRLGPAFYAGLNDDELPPPGALTEATMRGRGILSFLDPSNAAPPDSSLAPGYLPDQSPITYPGRPQMSGIEIADEPNGGETMAPGALSEAAWPALGILSYPGLSDIPPDEDPILTRPSHPDPTDASPDAAPAVLSPLGDVFFQDPPRDAGEQKRKGSIGHATDLESLIPLWGAGRNTLADLEEGNYGSAALNGAMFLSDLFLVGAPAKFIAKAALTGARKGGLKGAREAARYAVMGPIRAEKPSHTKWKYVRSQLGKHGMLEKYQHGHHWIVHRNEGIGRHIPEAIKNHPLNIMGMPKDLSVHGRLHGSYKGLPEYNYLQKYWYGTPLWFKKLNVDLALHGSDLVR
jgi:hypothetical protein